MPGQEKIEAVVQPENSFPQKAEPPKFPQSLEGSRDPAALRPPYLINGFRPQEPKVSYTGFKELSSLEISFTIQCQQPQ